MLNDSQRLQCKPISINLDDFPGGVAEESLRRELLEELHVGVLSIMPYGEFQAKALYEDALLVMRTYFVRIEGTPVAGNEIDSFVWLDAHFSTSGYQFASILGQQILPKLFAEGYLGLP